MKKQIKFSFLILAIMALVAGCDKKSLNNAEVSDSKNSVSSKTTDIQEMTIKDIKDWDVYQNDYYKFSIKYPTDADNFCLNDYCDNDIKDHNLQFFVAEKYIDTERYYYQVKIEPNKNLLNTTAIEFGKETEAVNRKNGEIVTNPKEVVFAGQPAYQFDIEKGFSIEGYLNAESGGIKRGDGSRSTTLRQKYRAIFLDKDENIYFIFYTVNKLTEGIISSFKFIK